MVRATPWLVAVVFAGAVSAAAQVPAGPPRDGGQVARNIPSGPRGTAAIRGRVVDAATGHGLSRVEMRAGPNATSERTVMTDGDGRYEIKDLTAGTYVIIAAKPNYVRTSWGEARAEGPGKRIPLADGQLLEKVDLTLQRAGVVTGKIVDEFGDPVTDVFVSTMHYQYVQGARRLTSAGHSGMTNDIGEFRVYGLSPGQYYVSATLRNIAVNGTGGDVADRTGYAPTYYPSAGNFADAQRLSIAPGQTVAGINLTLLPIRTVKLSGTALDAEGRPIQGAMINVTQSSGGTGTSVGMPIRADGKFTLTGLTPGDYILRMFGQNMPESASLPITVGSSDINDVQLVAAKPSTIRGRIAFTASATSAEPPKATAFTLGALRDWVIGQTIRNAAKISDDGTFEISLQAGHVLLRGAPNAPPTPPPTRGELPPTWRLNRVIVNDIDVGDSGIDVPASGSVENVIVEMTNRSNEVSGRITDADGNLVRDCFVIVFAQDPAKWTVQTRYLSVSRPALDDLFHSRLLPGDYYVVAMSDVETNAWTDPEFLSLARERALKFSIADGEKKSVDVSLTPRTGVLARI